MTARQIVVAAVALLAAAQICASGELLNPGADAAGLASCDAAPHRAPTGSLLAARAAAAPAPLTAKKPRPAGRATPDLPKGRQAAATAADPMDMDSGLRVTHRQRLELAGIFAFGAGVSIIMLIQASVDFVRSAIRSLDRTLTNLYGDPNRARRVLGRTQANEGGAGVRGDAGGDGRGG
jgi:hypothetical protein